MQQQQQQQQQSFVKMQLRRKKFECKNMSCHDAAAVVVVDKDFAAVVAKLAFLYLNLKTSERK